MNAVITFECRMQLKGYDPKAFVKSIKTSAKQTYFQWNTVPIKDVSTGNLLWKFVSNQKARLLPSKSSVPAIRKVVKIFKKSENYGVRIVKAELTGKAGIVNVTVQVYGVVNA